MNTLNLGHVGLAVTTAAVLVQAGRSKQTTRKQKAMVATAILVGACVAGYFMPDLTIASLRAPQMVAERFPPPISSEICEKARASFEEAAAKSPNVEAMRKGLGDSLRCENVFLWGDETRASMAIDNEKMTNPIMWGMNSRKQVIVAFKRASGLPGFLNSIGSKIFAVPTWYGCPSEPFEVWDACSSGRIYNESNGISLSPSEIANIFKFSAEKIGYRP
jgi:hypothetical protein